MIKCEYEYIITESIDGKTEKYANVSNLQVYGNTVAFTAVEINPHGFIIARQCEVIGKLVKVELTTSVNAQIIKEFIEVYRAGGMCTVVKVDKLALTETTLFKQFMEAVATEHGEE